MSIRVPYSTEMEICDLAANIIGLASALLLLLLLGLVFSLLFQGLMQLFNKMARYSPCINTFSEQGRSRAANHGMLSAASCPMTTWPALCSSPVDKSA